MKKWLVTVAADIPYPWDQTFTIEKSSPDAAASQAIKLFRKAIRESKGKAKKLDTLRLTIQKSNSL